MLIVCQNNLSDVKHALIEALIGCVPHICLKTLIGSAFGLSVLAIPPDPTA